MVFHEVTFKLADDTLPAKYISLAWVNVVVCNKVITIRQTEKLCTIVQYSTVGIAYYIKKLIHLLDNALK